MAERNEKGQFVKGEYKGGPGRPSRATEAEYLDALIEVTPLSAWKRIARKAVQQAERGDPRARQWLSDYIMGPPTQRLDVTSKGESIVKAQDLTDDELAAIAARRGNRTPDEAQGAPRVA